MNEIPGGEFSAGVTFVVTQELSGRINNVAVEIIAGAACVTPGIFHFGQTIPAHAEEHVLLRAGLFNIPNHILVWPSPVIL